MSERIVHIWGALRPLVGGAHTLAIEAQTIAGLFEKLIEKYPALENSIENGVAVSIGGEIYRDNWQMELPAEAEIYLMPRLPGG